MRRSRGIQLGAVVVSAAVTGCLLLTGVGAAAPTSARRQATTSSPIGTFLLIPNYPGESQQKGYENQIEVSDYSYAINGPAIKGTTMTKASFAPLSIAYSYDRSVPLLELAAARGTLIPTATLTEVNTNGAYLVVNLSELRVRSVSISSGDTSPKAEFSFTYAQEKTTYTPQNPDGTPGTPVTTCWSVALNSSC